MDDLSDSNLDNDNNGYNLGGDEDESSATTGIIRGSPYSMITGGMAGIDSSGNRGGRLKTRHRNLYDNSNFFENVATKKCCKPAKIREKSTNVGGGGRGRGQSSIWSSLQCFGLSPSLVLTTSGGGYQSSDGQEIADNYALKQKRTKKKRKTIESRRYERDQKRNFDEFADSPPAGSHGSLSSSRDPTDSTTALFGAGAELSPVGSSGAALFRQQHMSLPSPGRYRCLRANTKMIKADEGQDQLTGGGHQNLHTAADLLLEFDQENDDATKNSDDLSPTSSQRQQIWQERAEFYENFSILVHLGDRAMKFQDSQYYGLGASQNTNTSGISATPKPPSSSLAAGGSSRLTRRTSWSSTSASSTFSQQQRTKVLFGDWLWLHLQAWQAGKSLKSTSIYESLTEIDNELIEKRSQNMQILDDIKIFTFSTETNSRGLASSPGISIESQSPIDLIDNLSNYIKLQRRALRDVQTLFDRFDQLLSLFPNNKAFLLHAQNEYTPELDEKLAVLQIWLNLTRDLSRKMKIIGYLLEMHKVKGGVVDWPNLDYESPNQSRTCSSTNSSAPSSTRQHQKSTSSAVALMENNEEDHRQPIRKRKSTKLGGANAKTITPPVVVELKDPKTISDLTKLKINVKPAAPVDIGRQSSLDDEAKFYSQSETDLSETELSTGGGSSADQKNRRFSGIFSELFVTCPASVYKLFVERSLKLRGMRKVLARVGSILVPTLTRARLALQKRRPNNAPPGGLQFVRPMMNIKEPKIDKKDKDEEDLIKFGANNSIFKTTKLPTFYYSYLFLLKIPLNLTLEWLKIRIGQRSTLMADPLTLEQLIEDCKDCLVAASQVKWFYQYHVQSCTIDQKILEKLLVIDMEEFETDLFTMFDIYLEYVRQWSSHQTNLHKISSEWSQTLINILEEQWKFAKIIAINILSGESDAARRFCCINNEMYQSIEDLLEDLNDNLNNVSLNDDQDPQQQQQPPKNRNPHRSENKHSKSNSSTTSSTSGVHTTFNSGRRNSRKNSTRKSIRSDNQDCNNEDNVEYANEATCGGNDEHEIEDEDEEAVEESCMISPKSDDTFSVFRFDSRKSSRIFKSCRIIRHFLHEIREKSLRALTFSKFIRRDLEISARYELKCDHLTLLAKLFETNHYLLKTVNFRPDFLIFCKDTIAQDEEFLQLLLNVTCGRDEREIPPRIAKLKGYLLLINCGKEKSEELSQKWMGNVKTVTPNADTNLALHHLDVDGVYLVVTGSARLKEQRNALNESFGSDCLKIVDEQCSCHGMIAECVQDLKNSAMKLRSKLIEWLSAIENEYSMNNGNNVIPNLDDNEKQTYRDVLIQVYNFVFEYHKELFKMVTGPVKADLMDGVRLFAQQWTRFVLQVCERGHGARPRWANDGLNFLVFASEPTYTITLSESEFADLKKSINDCIDHIIGSKPTTSSKVTCPQQTTNQNSTSGGGGGGGTGIDSVHRAVSWPQTKNLAMEMTFSNNAKPGGPRHSLTVPGQMTQSTSVEVEQLAASVSMATRSDTIILDKHSRVVSEINRLETSRELKLKLEKRIGRCVERKLIKPHSQIALKRANFRWQRLNNKIGSGKFGSVYTAINLDTSKLMAVKQIKFQKQDHQAMQSLVDEVTNFEGIEHENLVRYFGVEIHRDELFIFMEYCSEGTLETLCVEGLSEDLVRLYTLHLLTAVCELHRRGIVHRDIKTANIFLSNVSNERYVVKLGDFGSSVRLKDTTTAMGELTSYVGTPAYMAPEVCTSSHEGYGRTADIWSVGCVVLEMTTGKPPWHDLTNTYAIIWKVGNGAIPNVPDTLSPCCKDFLLSCFKFKSSSRFTAEQLLEHPFVKVHN